MNNLFKRVHQCFEFNFHEYHVEKFKQMLNQQAEATYKLKPRENGEEPIVCDTSNPICRKFYVYQI